MITKINVIGVVQYAFGQSTLFMGGVVDSALEERYARHLAKKLNEYGVTIEVVANHEFGELPSGATPDTLWVINRNVVSSLKTELLNKQFIVAEHGDVFRANPNAVALKVVQLIQAQDH
ncbi:hypothetical protein [Paucilactobacillus kaifaensis]|uniref:hypothetical protein n=1 Tax=Paucilactobacillus kaifaensis TaxID=2559921 RepID=UPI0010FA53E3|nr:hypothetical protein [Paucilactobacillus kaifaensis]